MTEYPNASRFLVATLLLALAGCSGQSSPHAEDDIAANSAALRGLRGAVYTSTNAASGNELVAFDRSVDGTLTLEGRYKTGGLGLGAGLGSQGALAVAYPWLFVVNAGSNEISTFTLYGKAPKLVAKTSSGGTRPISLTVHGAVLYALNAAAPANISGFRIRADGSLRGIEGSTRALSGADVAPAQVSFSPDGDTLVVTEKGTQKIDSYAVDWLGRAQAAHVIESSGITPFGFGFTPRSDLIVSEAFGGQAMQSAVSSYDADHARNVSLVSASVPNGQSAACWVAVSETGRYAYVANTGSGTLSSYRISHDGSIDVVGNGVAVSTGQGTRPGDLALTPGGRYLYGLIGGSFTIAGFEVHGSDLDLVEDIANVSNTPAGLVAL